MEFKDNRIDLIAEAAAKEMLRFINNFGCDETAFVETIARDHRTLQQGFTRVCVKWLELLAKNPYGHDLRNEASYELAKKFVQRLDASERALPFI